METNENSVSYALTHSPNKLLPLIPLISKIRFQFINFWQVSQFYGAILAFKQQAGHEHLEAPLIDIHEVYHDL